MGWLWSSSSTPQKGEPQPTQLPQQHPAQENLPTPPQPKQPSREEQADAEFTKLWADLQSDISKSPMDSKNITPTTTQTPAAALPSPPASIAPDSLYPDTMSCRAAFDYAFFCQSIGGQFVNVYRYGELRSCSEHWENFWLCMKTRTQGDQEKKRVIRDHYRKKAIKYKTGPSSEDVWDVRMDPVKHAFQGDFAALEREMKEEEDAELRAKQTPLQRAATSI
ncbi:hypothetical protein BJY04DRAFT_201619 [Aspergillus karnatakaensis]|uniref:EMI1 family protein n=1 Tax=Aspergillus karnatakaensis TaxID=1810916 RepID=UPI003CCCE9D3